jgi:hypothetical protein
MHFLLQKIHQAWIKGKMALLLLFDISGTYNNISKNQLLHNLQKCKISKNIVQWTKSFLSDKNTTLKLQKYTAPLAPIWTNIFQRSLILPILYLFYNANLVKVCKMPNTKVVKYINNMSTLAVNQFAQHNCKTLKKIHQKAQKWAFKHGSQFAPAKYELVHFTKNPKKNSTHGLHLPNAIIQAFSSCQYLDIHMDTRLQ